MPIRVKAVLIFLALSLTPLAVVGWLAYSRGEETIRRSLGSSFQRIAHEAIDKVDRGLYAIHQNVRSWADLELMDQVLTRDVDNTLSTFLIRLSTEYRDLASLFVLTREGEVVAASPLELIGRTFPEERFFQEALRGHPFIQDVHLDPVQNTWVVTFAFPIHAQFEADKIIGVLCAKWDASALVTMIQSTPWGADGVRDRRILTRKDGLIIAAPAAEQEAIFRKNLLEHGLEAAKRASREQSGYLVEPDDRGTTALIGYDSSRGYLDFPALGWVALVTQDVQTAFAPIEQLKVMMLGVGVIAAGGAILLSLVLARRMTGPILQVADVARRVAKGDFEGRVEHRAKDEVGMLATTVNQMITDLKHQRAELVEKAYVENIVGSMIETLIVVDSEALIRTVNRAACALLGYEELELIGRPLATIFPEGACPLPPSTLTGAPEPWDISHAEKTYVAKDGRRVPVLFSAAVMRDTQAEAPGVVCVASDISELKRAEEAIQRHAAELARSNAELEQFAYIASHDLQEPLRMVASYTQLLARRYQGKLDPDADAFITFAVEGAIRMQRLIADLLHYSRVGTKGKPFVPTSCDAVLAQVLTNLRMAIEESGAVITRGPLPTVTADELQLMQLFQNLIGNAIKFRQPSAPPHIAISATREEAVWRFQVTDDGIGFDQPYADRIFVVFQRLHTSDAYPGTGIGLAICKKIVERHGGRVWATSSLGHGATFSFTLPLEPQAEGHA